MWTSTRRRSKNASLLSSAKPGEKSPVLSSASRRSYHDSKSIHDERAVRPLCLVGGHGAVRGTTCCIACAIWFGLSQNADATTQAQLRRAIDIIHKCLRFDSAGL